MMGVADLKLSQQVKRKSEVCEKRVNHEIKQAHSAAQASRIATEEELAATDILENVENDTSEIKIADKDYEPPPSSCCD